ncbi:MAG: glycerol-3-phosphate cytidylyltransferase [Ichthyobacteriaceae bacterium]|nr:glycerol-3-phosphate cytidylyltransferase [Ichthyobacteriaceae bacterium]
MKIAIIGAGQFGTALGNSLTINKNNAVCLFSTDYFKVDEINNKNKNTKVFPNTFLSDKLYASSDLSKLKDFDIIFIAIPSSSIGEFFENNKMFISDGTLIVNLAKGLISKEINIVDYVKQVLPNCDVITLKGPTFASELIHGSNSIFTLGYSKRENHKSIIEIIKGTNVFIDTTTDITGVEVLSVLKNIYAILVGYTDAKYNSANTRFLVLTKSFNEIIVLLKSLGGDESTINLSCGFGDLGLTSLNDLSRNRTLGLLMGKGFYSDSDNSVVLEGKKSLDMILDIVPDKVINRLPLLKVVKKAFLDKTGIIDIDFEDLVIQREKVILTYGTFDLLHYGHLEILRRAKSYGTKLIVGLSTDEFNLEKGKTCIHSYEKRKELLESLSYVHKVIPEKNWNQKIDNVKKYNIDVFVMGDDWKGEFDFLKDYCDVDYLPRTKGISTTQLKRILKKD